MDLCVIAALIESKGLEQVSGCDLSVLRGKKESVEMAKFESPKTLPAQCSFLKTANGWIVTTSGGVMVDGWSVSNNTKVNEALEDIRSKVSAQPLRAGVGTRVCASISHGACLAMS